VTALAWFVARLRRQRAELNARLLRDARLAGLGRLSAAIAHEVRNPLNSIGIAMQRMRRAMVPEGVAHLADTVLDEVRRLDRTVEEVLQCARPAPPRSTRFDAGALVDAVAALIRPEAEEASVTVQTDVRGDHRPNGDPDLLKGALVNLARNAVQAAPGGTIVRLSVRAARGSVRFLVEDEGAGVPDALRESLFEPFRTAAPVGGRKGAGLGLSLALGAAQAHGGTIEVENRTEGGARFTLVLPEDETE
jgi:signal transduction histidine kinase